MKPSLRGGMEKYPEFCCPRWSKFDETQTHDEIGTFTADVAFQKGQISGGLAYFGIYGWTVDPLVEFM